MAPPTLLLAQLLKEAGLPAGVLNVVMGNDPVRVKVAQNNQINHITYSGSKQVCVCVYFCMLTLK